MWLLGLDRSKQFEDFAHSRALWDVADRRRPHRMATLSGGLGAMSAAVFSSDGHTFVGVVGDGSIMAWDVSDRMHPRRLIAVPDFHASFHAFNAFSPDRRTLVMAMAQRAGIQWNVLDWV